MSPLRVQMFLCGIATLALTSCADPVSIPSDGSGSDGSRNTADPTARLGRLTDEVATAICDALSRCCDADSSARYFSVLRENPKVPEALRTRLTAQAADPSQCVALVSEVYRVVPLGGWIDAALAGQVEFVMNEADACLDTLSGARCGAEVRMALFDGTCFGFGPPPGGALQRRMFRRTAGPDSACVPLSDGVGGSFFGTCDPARAYCCGPRSDGSCGPASATGGVCRPASAEGESCTLVPQLRVCATGLECSTGGRCEASLEGPLRQGDVCMRNFSLLGNCVDSWCDFGGTDRCEPLRELGETCTSPEACRTGTCSQGTCQVDAFCDGLN